MEISIRYHAVPSNKDVILYRNTMVAYEFQTHSDRNTVSKFQGAFTTY